MPSARAPTLGGDWRFDTRTLDDDAPHADLARYGVAVRDPEQLAYDDPLTCRRKGGKG